MTSVVIADDHALVRSGLRMILQATTDLRVVGEAPDGAAAVELVRRTGPDVVLMDLHMPGMDGVEATRLIVDGGSSTRVLVVTTFDTEPHLVDSLVAGASGFLLKDTDPDLLVAAVRAVAGGDVVVSPRVTRFLVRQLTATRTASPSDPPDTAVGAPALTGREREVVALIADGCSNAEIAARLVLAETTVKTHMRNILDKLGLRDRVQVVVWWYRTGSDLVFPAIDRR